MSVGVAPPYFYYYKDYIMNKTEVSALISALQNGIVNITFKKIITNEIRIMESSLNQRFCVRMESILYWKVFHQIRTTSLCGVSTREHGVPLELILLLAGRLCNEQ